MAGIPKIIGVIPCAFVLCGCLSSAYAAHPQAETRPSDDRGSQGNQDKIKGESTPKNGGQDEKVDANKLREEKRSAKEEFDKRNAAGQKEMSDQSKVPMRTLQNK